MFKAVKKYKMLILASALLAPVAANAGVRILDFDYDANGAAIASGAIIDDEYAAWGVTVSGCNINGSLAAGTNQTTGTCGAGDAVQSQAAFNTLDTNTLDPDLEFILQGDGSYKSLQGTGASAVYDPLTDYEDYYSDLYGASAAADAWESPGNVMIIHERPNECIGNSCGVPDDEADRPAGFFVFDFAEPVDILSLDFFDVEVSESQLSQPAAKLFFHLADNSIVESSVPGIGNGNYTREVYDNLFSVSKLVVNMPGSGAINNLVLRNTQSVEVSAPATLAFISLGLAFIGYRRFK
jgi:hypothetical protein